MFQTPLLQVAGGSLGSAWATFTEQRQFKSPHFTLITAAPQSSTVLPNKLPRASPALQQQQQQMLRLIIVVNNDVVFSFFQKKKKKMVNGNEWGSQIKLLYTKVQLIAEGALLFQPVEFRWLWCAQS